MRNTDNRPWSRTPPPACSPIPERPPRHHWRMKACWASGEHRYEVERCNCCHAERGRRILIGGNWRSWDRYRPAPEARLRELETFRRAALAMQEEVTP